MRAPEAAVLTLGQERVALHPMGAAYMIAHETLIVADLHFEKGSAFAERGVFLPPYDTRTTLRRLAVLCRALKPKTVVSLGDAFHDAGAEARLDPEDSDLLEALISAHRWIWALGNHDPAPPRRFAGDVVDAVRLGSVELRHDAASGGGGPGVAGEISGHYHPCARVRIEGRAQRRRCFAAGSGRLILPAFGAYAGGLNILDRAFAPFFDSPIAWLLGAEAVYPMPAHCLEPDTDRAGRAIAR